MENQNITSEEVRTEIKRLVAEVTESEEEKIGDQDNYLLDLDLDSLMALEVMVTLSKKYRIEIPEEEFSRLQNVDDTVKLVMFYLERAGQTASQEQILKHLAAAGLSKYEMPEFFIELADMPLMPNGKIQRQDLTKWVKEGRIVPEQVSATKVEADARSGG